MTTSTSLMQLIASLIIGLTIVYMTLSFLQRRLIKKHDMQINNSAFAIFAAAILFCVGYLISGANQPFLNTVKIIQQNQGSNFMLECVKYAGLFLFIGGLAALSIVFCSLFIYSSIMKGVKSMEEIKNNNLAVAIISAAIIIALTLIVRDNAVSLMESFIPYPTSPVVY